MDGLLTRVMAICLFLGFFGAARGGYLCVKGHTYAMAAQHEATAVGRVVGIYTGRSPAYHYVFSVNGVKMDDSSEVCQTPLAPGACSKNGPVLVYYSYQPYSNSRLEDFAVASIDAYRFGKPALGIGLPLFILAFTAIVIQVRKETRERDQDSDAKKGRSKSDDVPDAIHIAPGE
jgi:hypothetical protein